MTEAPPAADTIEPALAADGTLCDVAMALDYLLAVTPVDVPEAWRAFRAAGYRTEPGFRYRPLSPDLPRLLGLVEDLPLEAVEDHSLRTLLAGKQQELRTQIRSLEGRGSPRLLEASLALYGGVDDGLLELAEQVLAGAPFGSPATTPGRPRGVVGARTFARRARAELQRYRQAHPAFESRVEVREDIPGVMAFEGDLLVGAGLRLPAARVEALIQHEVGTHLVTYANGSVHRLRQLQVGLPGYEETQEALAVFAEFAVGGLTRARLAQLAARVVAVRGLLDGGTFAEVFRVLHRRHRMPPRATFSVVARVFRKLPLESLTLLPHLERLSLVRTPPLRPTWLDEPGARRRIEAAAEVLSPLDLLDLAEEDAA
jgi:uncharacterized protein (TIGR02421 family)